jgi:cytochrome oxidase assembly protein ShyY1
MKEKNSLLKSLVALLLIAACLWATQWQFQRGIDRHDKNSQIAEHIQLSETKLEQAIGDVTSNEWRTVKVSGTFEPTHQILLRNRYFEGQYGFEVLTRFTSVDGKSFWVDRGWVKAGASAITPPVLTDVPLGRVDIQGRLRLDSSLPQGAFFAMPASKNGGLIRKLNAQSGLASENFYIDLISGSDKSLTPAVPAQLPELSDGPHMAYAVQWLFFAGLIVYGRLLIRRSEILSSKKL